MPVGDRDLVVMGTAAPAAIDRERSSSLSRSAVASHANEDQCRLTSPACRSGVTDSRTWAFNDLPWTRPASFIPQSSASGLVVRQGMFKFAVSKPQSFWVVSNHLRMSCSAQRKNGSHFGRELLYADDESTAPIDEPHYERHISEPNGPAGDCRLCTGACIRGPTVRER